jgi:hypothetical protein
MTPVPQKKSEILKLDPNQDVGTQFKNMMIQGLQSSKKNPMIFVQIGDMARQAISDKSLYPMVKKAAIDNQILNEDSFQQGFDFKLLSVLVAMGKVAKEYMQQTQGRTA